MKLNSKLPIVMIGFTIAVFLGISISNSVDKPYIQTISGQVDDLDEVDINVLEYETSLYYNYKHTINKNEIATIKDTKKYIENEHSKYVELMDVSCNQDNISNIGYEVDYSSDKNQIYLIIDERKNNEKHQILKNQGKNIYIQNKDVNLNNLNRTKIKLEYPKISPEIEHASLLYSYRYNGELYVVSRYFSSDVERLYATNNIVISKLNKETKELDEIDTINLKEEITRLIYLNNGESFTYNDKFYTVIMTYKFDEESNEENEIYLLEYDIANGKHSIENINNPRGYQLLRTNIKNDKLNIILSKTTRDVELINIEYNVTTKEKNNEFKVLVEPYSKNNKNRVILDAIVKEDNIYLIVSDKEIYNQYKSDPSIYVINKETKDITYEGKVLGGENFEF